MINDFIAHNGVSDIWRFNFNNKKAFSFFSNVDHTYTRIDYFFLDNRLLGNVTSCSYHSITISDHGAVSCHVALPNCPRPSRNWRLNPLLLADEQFVNHVSSQISFFLETNVSPEISNSELCPMFRAMLNESLTSGCVPPTLQQAAMTLLQKGGKDPLYCASYRPIYLLNTDYKILS